MASFLLRDARFWLLVPALITCLVSLFLHLSYYNGENVDDALIRRNLIPVDHLGLRLVQEQDLPGNVSQLVRRAGDDDIYHCKKGVLCKTVACCGSFLGTDTGTCGFGPTFCGSDCDSQCDAKPECGQFSNPPGKTCPLNVCCSEFGFCGSTADFCATGCQSNCVLDPPIPPGGSGVTVLNNKVIGYYEAWSARRGCRTFPPGGIPVQGLTHVNFAFAYIDPSTLKVTTMDSETPEALFAQTTDIKHLKSRSSELQVFVSIGGWTFSDNDTATQAVFPAIAADPAKRQTFANNLVSFMTRYGFDGVDLDWEYPGAPDRGGLEEKDIANFPLLLQTIKSTFRASPRGDYGLTFTIPTSFWYLRWFDVPSLLKYADWVNLMSYDLHGVWDAHNPIGNIVQSHTNLTEIKLAANLLWRNNVPPGKVVLGVGFYGRSFELSDKSCSSTGCQFKGPGAPGTCTKSAGTLAYFEIQDIIRDRKPKVVHDSVAAANYMIYGDNQDQWISFDDKTTFKAKIDWANSVGLGGVMVWSVDQDDEDFSALEGLLGRPLPSFQANLKRVAVADGGRWSSVNGQACKVSDCLSDDANPPAGFSIAPNGKFKDRCGGGQNKYVYCPTEALPQHCEWRGSGSCHGQCHAGEVTLAHSPHGDKSCLAPGQQAFCCQSTTWSQFVDKCAWGPKCGDCPSDAPFSVNTRSVYAGFLSSCDQHFCCPYNFQNCHWVGKGTCDDNECSATDVEVGLDPMGDTGSLCAGGFSSRQKPLCCNTPQDLNPFLPVPLVDLFPTLPPTTDVPAFDQQTLNQLPSLVGANPIPNAFFFIVIDGPPGAVSNVNKRDGSHLEFLTTRGLHDGLEPQTAQFVCMDDSPGSNCDAMHLEGLEGSVLRMPDGMGFAKYAVAHGVRTTHGPLPPHLGKRAPPSATIVELEYSYNFSRVKRDAGDIFVRIDYSDSHSYYTDIVQAPHQKLKRHVEPRFWSKLSSVWKTLIDKTRAKSAEPSHQPTIHNDNFNVLIYGNDGKNKGCNGADGFLKLNLAGSMRNVMRFGFTLVGRIQPFVLEEAYGYFDSDLFMSAQLQFDGKGILNVGNGAGVARDLFSSPLTSFQASHPGIVSFSPQLNTEVSLVGSGQIDGQFSVSFEAGSSSTMRTNAPPGLGTFTGDTLNHRLDKAADGFISVTNPTSNTLFAVNLNLETTMNLKLFGYQTSLQNAGARLSSRTPHAIRVVGDTGTGHPGIFDAPQQATSDVIQVGTVQNGWDDGSTHPVGSVPSPAIVFTDPGRAPPSDRKVPDVNGYAVFGDRDFMSCSGGSTTRPLVCFYDIHANDSSLEQPKPPFKRKRGELMVEPLSKAERKSFLLVPRAPGPSGGAAETYTIIEFPANPNGPTNAFNFETPTYPAGNDGAALDAETGRNERYALDDPDDCENTDVTAAGLQGVHWAGIDSDHIDDRSIFPNHFANFIQSGELDLADGQGGVFRTQHNLWGFDRMLNYFASDYRTWAPAGSNPPPGSAMRDVADAMGSTNNPDVMINLERNLNILKGRLYTTEGLPTADTVWDDWMRDLSATTAEAAFAALRAVFAVFNYMRANQATRLRVFQDRRAALQQFDTLYAQAFPNRPERMVPLIDEFQPQWEIRVTNFARRYVAQRLDQMENAYDPLDTPGNPRQALAQEVLAAVARMRAKIATELRFS